MFPCEGTTATTGFHHFLLGRQMSPGRILSPWWARPGQTLGLSGSQTVFRSPGKDRERVSSGGGGEASADWPVGRPHTRAGADWQGLALTLATAVPQEAGLDTDIIWGGGRQLSKLPHPVFLLCRIVFPLIINGSAREPVPIGHIHQYYCPLSARTGAGAMRVGGGTRFLVKGGVKGWKTPPDV